MSFLLDTCAVSDWASPRPNAGLQAWMDAQPDEALYLSVVTVGELVRGVHLLAPGKKRTRLERWLATLRTRFRDRLLCVDEPIAALWGQLSARSTKLGKPLHIADGLLAATALHHGWDIVTRNGKDFHPAGASIIDPWS